MSRAESRKLGARSKVKFTHNLKLIGKFETSIVVQDDITELLVRKGNSNSQFVCAHTESPNKTINLRVYQHF